MLSYVHQQRKKRMRAELMNWSKEELVDIVDAFSSVLHAYHKSLGYDNAIALLDSLAASNPQIMVVIRKFNIVGKSVMDKEREG